MGPAWIRKQSILVAVREAAPLCPRREGHPLSASRLAEFRELATLVAMGAAKAAMESWSAYFAVALAQRGITVTHKPGWVEDSVLNSLPEAFQTGIREWQERAGPQWAASELLRYWQRSPLICSPERLGLQASCRCGRRRIAVMPTPLEFQGIAKQKPSAQLEDALFRCKATLSYL